MDAGCVCGGCRLRSTLNPKPKLKFEAALNQGDGTGS